MEPVVSVSTQKDQRGCEQQQGSVFDRLGGYKQKRSPVCEQGRDLGADSVGVTYPRCYINEVDQLGIQVDTRHGSQPDTQTGY
jgi:hypothetical protein